MQKLTKRLSIWAIGIGLLMILPLTLTLTGSGVDGVGFHWTFIDFVFMGVVFFGAALAFELMRRKADSIEYRYAAVIAVLTTLALVWINGAVGIISDGDGGNPTNLMYLGVILIGIVGSFLARFESKGMSRTLFAAALAQALVPLAALVVWSPEVHSWGHLGIAGVFILNSFFVIAFLVSGLLFRQAVGISIISWLFGLGVLAIGIVNMFWGSDMEFGIFVGLLSLAYFLPINSIVEKTLGFRVPKLGVWKVALGIFILWAAVGVGELFDKVDLMLTAF